MIPNISLWPPHEYVHISTCIYTEAYNHMHIYTGRQHTDIKMEGGRQKLLFYWQLATKRIKLFKIPILGNVL